LTKPETFVRIGLEVAPDVSGTERCRAVHSTCMYS